MDPFQGCLLVLSCLVLSCLVLSCLVLSCPALPYPALPCPALPCPALPCPALPCPALPCLAFSCHFKANVQTKTSANAGSNTSQSAQHRCYNFAVLTIMHLDLHVSLFLPLPRLPVGTLALLDIALVSPAPAGMGYTQGWGSRLAPLSPALPKS